MKLINYKNIEPTRYDSEDIKGVAARVLIGKKDGAKNFCMRVFEFTPGGHTRRHTHEWEHEMFIHSGYGEIYHNGKWNPVEAGKAVFMPGNEEHQIRNNGKEQLIVICLVPPKAPEL
jgi:quercetin dioxygenase-like cupin family protein